MKVIVYLPPYSEKTGGVIALHKLLHLLQVGDENVEAYGFPYYDGLFFDIKMVLNGEPKEVAKYQITLEKLNKFQICSSFNYKFLDISSIDTLNIILESQEVVVIYPEVIAGNPLGSKHVVRWLLHDPGRLTGRVYYETGELYFPYIPLSTEFAIPQSKTSSKIITVLHIPFDLFNREDEINPRQGSAYCMRKGRGRQILHDLSGSICIDDLPQTEIAKIFKRVEFFYSYDTRTFYSELAALSGCKSVIIPHPYLDVGESSRSLNGVAFGLDDIDRAEQTKPALIRELREKEEMAVANVSAMVKEIRDYFGMV